MATDNSKLFLLCERTELKYGTRHLNRTIHRLVAAPLANPVATRQIRSADRLSFASRIIARGSTSPGLPTYGLPTYGISAKTYDSTAMAATFNRKSSSFTLSVVSALVWCQSK